MLEMICAAKDIDGKLSCDIYVLDVGLRPIKANGIKKKEFTLVNKYSQLSDLIRVDASKIRKKTLFLQNERMFEGKIVLPKLSGKTLNEAFENEMKNRYGPILKKYDYVYRQTVNESKGYDFDVVLYNKEFFNESLKTFLDFGISFDDVYYLPSMYSRIVDNTHNEVLGFFLINDKYESFYSNGRVVLGYSQSRPYNYNLDLLDLNNFIGDMYRCLLTDKRTFKIDCVITNIPKTYLEEAAAFDTAFDFPIDAVEFVEYDLAVECYVRDNGYLVALPTKLLEIGNE